MENTNDIFWEIIENAKGDYKSAEEIIGSSHLDKVPDLAALYTSLANDLYVVLDSYVKDVSDDGFTDFIGYVISQGKEFYENLLANPKTCNDATYYTKNGFKQSNELFVYIWSEWFWENKAKEAKEGDRIVLEIQMSAITDWLTDEIYENNDFKNFVYKILSVGFTSLSRVKDLGTLFRVAGGSIPTFVINSPESVFSKGFVPSSTETCLSFLTEDNVEEAFGKGVNAYDVAIDWNKGWKD